MYNPLPNGHSSQGGAARAMPTWQPLKPLKPIELQNAGFVQANHLGSKINKFALWTVEEQQAANKMAETALSDDLQASDVSVKSDPESTLPASHTSDASGVSGYDAEALEKLKQEAYERGLAEGQQMQLAAQQAQKEEEEATSLASLAEKANQILANIEQGVLALQENPASYNEPLKRLALHLAEQLTLCELSMAATSVQTLIDRCIETLDVQSTASVVVELNPNDLALLQNHKAVPGEPTQTWRMLADTHLLPGSVRVRADDAVVSDLIEHRLESLAQVLLEKPKLWQAQTAFHPERLSARRGKAETVEDALPRQSSDARDARETQPEPLDLSALDLPDLNLPEAPSIADDSAEDVSHD